MNKDMVSEIEDNVMDLSTFKESLKDAIEKRKKDKAARKYKESLLYKALNRKED